MNNQRGNLATSDHYALSGSEPLAGHRSTLALLMLAYTLSICDRMILSILFPDIKAEFGLSDAQLGLLGGISFALFYATMGLPIARLSDQYSRKRIIIASLIIFSLMTALGGMATGFISLLVFRIGVGIGEAGVNPASHSIIADYFPPQRRGLAMATLMLGGSFGMMLAASMWANPAMRHLIAGSVVAGLMSYGLTQWLPTFFIREHDLSQSQTGMLMAGVFGILGAIGALVAGKLFDRLAIRGFQYGMWMLAAVPFFSIPFFIMGLLAENLTTAMLLFIIPAFAGNYALGPTLAMIQTLSPVNMRAVSAAIKMLFINLIGMGLGPLLVGLLSDFLSPRYGENSLSVALAYFTLVGVWGSLHFWLCGRALVKQKRLQDTLAAANSSLIALDR